jgi:hypothetical protein
MLQNKPARHNRSRVSCAVASASGKWRGQLDRLLRRAHPLHAEFFGGAGTLDYVDCSCVELRQQFVDGP